MNQWSGGVRPLLWRHVRARSTASAGGGKHSGCVRPFSSPQTPVQQRATAQGLFNAAMGGIGSATGGFVGGLLFDDVGAKGMYLIFCAFVVVVLAFVNFAERALPAEVPPEPVSVIHPT